MNTKILDLFETSTEKCFPKEGDDVALWGSNINKFAEAIIKQCAHLSNVYGALGCPIDKNPEDYTPGDFIKDYFGVK